MKILIVYPRFYVYGGGETLVVNLCNYLTKMGVINAILTTEMIPDVENDLKNTDVFIENNKHLSTKLHLIGEIAALKRGVKKLENDYDIINIHNFPAEIAGLKSKKPVVWMCNEPELYLIINQDNFRNSSLQYKLYLKYLYFYETLFIKKRFKKSIVSDEYNARRFESIYNTKPHIINYGIDVDFFSKKDPETGLTKNLVNKFIILHVGMITPFKCQLETLTALNDIKEKIPNAMIVFAGSGFDENYKKIIDKYIKENSLDDHVTFTGHISKNDLKELYYKSNVLMHPIKPQGGWLSPFEMLCTGNPIIVSKEMTAAYIIEQQKIGTVTDNYADSILDIYNNREKHQEIALHGQKFVKKNITWDMFSKNMLEAFKLSLEEI